jgi:hypothetical protein
VFAALVAAHAVPEGLAIYSSLRQGAPVSALDQLAVETVSAAARLHGDDATGQLANKGEDGPTPHPQQQHAPATIEPDDAAAVLAQVDANDPHVRPAALLCPPDRSGGEGRAIP